MVHKEKDEASVLVIEEEGIPWYYDIMKFLELGVYPDGADKRECHLIRMMAMQYILCGGQLYKRSYTPSLSKKRRSRESYGRNSSRDLWSLYEWENVSHEDLKDGVLLEMETNCINFVKSCHDC